MPWQKQFDVNEALERAMQVFWTRGYEATSLQHLVTATGVNRASLYATYHDKHTLFLASLERYEQEYRRRLMATLERTAPGLSAIRSVFQTFVDLAVNSGDRKGCFLTNTALECAAHDPKVARIVARGQAEMEQFFARMITVGQTRGEIPSTVTPPATASGLLAALLGLLVLVRSRPERALLDQVVAGAMAMLE